MCKIKNGILFFAMLLLFDSCLSQNQSHDSIHHPTILHNAIIHPEFKRYFEECGVTGSIIIYDYKNQQCHVSDTTEIHKRYLPASTFKILNLLIALETKTIKDENEIIKWVGHTDTMKYGYRPEIYHDMSVKEAFQVSAGWVFVTLAQKIGKSKYMEFLEACHYGNVDISEKGDDFWNFGSFAISALEQVQFMKSLWAGKLPFSNRNIDILQKVMISEEKHDEIVRAKTGWTRDRGINTGWWVGHIQHKDNAYFFATCIKQDREMKRNDFGPCRKTITKRILNDLRITSTENVDHAVTDSLYSAIDHVPIVVNDLSTVRKIFGEVLKFTIKKGKPHEGIENCFIKFQDGTYLEFISPLDQSLSIGKYYAESLAKRSGATSLAIATNHSALIDTLLRQRHIEFSYAQNKIWTTLEPKNGTLFFIEYADKYWKDSPSNVSHINEAMSLSAVYILSNHYHNDIQQYLSLGFKVDTQGEMYDAAYTRFCMGKNYLYLFDGTSSGQLHPSLNVPWQEGICGFRIKVRSLDTLKKLIDNNIKTGKDNHGLTIHLHEYNFFITFTE